MFVLLLVLTVIAFCFSITKMDLMMVAFVVTPLLVLTGIVGLAMALS